jgi:hypothetical protein
MRATLVMIAALGKSPVAEPVLMVLFGSILLALATWLRRTSVRNGRRLQRRRTLSAKL